MELADGVLAVMKDVNADGGGHAVGLISLDAIEDMWESGGIKTRENTTESD